MSDAAPPDQRGPSPWLVFALAGAAYLLLAQPEPYGDGISYLVWLRDRNFLAHHLLYLPALWLGTRLPVALGASEARAAFWFSGLCAAAAVALLHHLLRRPRALRAPLSAPGPWVLLVATAPVTVFYATQVENHAHHLLWVALALLALDRALAPGAGTGRALAAGLVLALGYASHASIVLLLPALVILAWRLTPPPLRPRLWRLGLLFGPVAAYKLADPWIKAVLLGGGPAYLEDRSLDFALRTMQAKSPAEWVHYLNHEILLAAPVLWPALFWAARRAGRLVLFLVALAPYLLLFGHWPVEEYGAYYLPVLLFGTVAVAGRLGPRARTVLAFGALLQAGPAVHLAVTWARRNPDPPWAWAADAARLARPGDLVFARDGLRCLHLDYDRGIRYVPLEGLRVVLLEGAGGNSRGMAELAEQVLPARLRAEFEAGRRVFVSAEGWRYLSEVFPRFRASILRNFRLARVAAGRFSGFRILPKG